jgi:hypothetical protein
MSIHIPTVQPTTPTGIMATLCTILGVQNIATVENTAINLINQAFGNIQFSFANADFSQMFNTQSAIAILDQIYVTYNGTQMQIGQFIQSLITPVINLIFNDQFSILGKVVNITQVAQNIQSLDINSLIYNLTGVNIS